MSKKCTPLWREAHFEVKMLKTPGFGPLLDVKMSFRCRFAWQAQGIVPTTSKSMFRARLPSIFNTSHKMPRLPRNLQVVTTWCSPDNAICKTLTPHVRGKIRVTHLLKTTQKYCACPTLTWGGVGWGGDVNVPSTTFPRPCARCWCYAHMGWGGVGMFMFLPPRS